MNESIIPGVTNATEAVWEEIYYGDSAVDLTLEEMEREYRLLNGLGDTDDIPDEFYECLDTVESEWLIGDWEKGDDGLYDIKPKCKDKGFAAVVGYLGGAPLVHVRWSETVRTVRSMCSPCCPFQADLDSGEGDIAAYALPPDYEWNGEDQ